LANPQKEDGYTAIANEILEAMARIKLSPTQYRLLFVVWRYTYGFQRKEADLSLAFLSNATGCDKRQLQREIKGLVDRKIIFQRLEKCLTRVIGFNKDHESWLAIGEIDIVCSTNGETDNGETCDSAIGETDNPPIGEIDNQERKSLKKTLKKNKVPKGTLKEPPNPAVKNLLLYYAEKFKQKFNEEPVIDWGKDGKLIKELLKPKTEEQLKTCLDRFFLSTDDWIQRSGYTIGAFKSQVNKLIIDQKTGSKRLPRGYQSILDA
jgi:phage replication O-like protein O